MELTADKIELVETTWAAAATLGSETVGVLLFENIFKLAPGAVAMFGFADEVEERGLANSPKLKGHAVAVVETVATAIGMLGDLDTLVPVLEDLGTTHVGYGIAAAHYDVVGQALIDTLAAGLGDKFTPHVKDAWLAVWAVIATTMKADHYD